MAKLQNTNNNDFKDTNYVVCSCARAIQDGMYLEDIWLLGWNNRTDWFTGDIDACDIMTEDGDVKQCKFGLLIDVDEYESAYVGNTREDCQSYCDSANREGYDCCVCRIEKDENGDWLVYKEGE